MNGPGLQDQAQIHLTIDGTACRLTPIPTTVLSGTYWSGVGETFDESRLEVFPAGSFYVIPAGVPHFSAVLEGEVEFQEAGVGPSSHDLVKSSGGEK